MALERVGPRRVGWKIREMKDSGSSQLYWKPLLISALRVKKGHNNQVFMSSCWI